jgi:hypothetical protein
MKRHIFWSHPNPWANIIGCAPCPKIVTLFRRRTDDDRPHLLTKVPDVPALSAILAADGGFRQRPG